MKRVKKHENSCSETGYDNSRNEEFADVFSSRLSGATNKAQNKLVRGPLSRGVSIVDFIKDSEKLY